MKKLLCITAALLFVLPMIAMGQDIRSAWIANTDPGQTALGDAPWGVENETNHPVAAGANVWIGVNNDFRWVNMKTLTVTLTGNGVHLMTVTDVLGSMAGGMNSNYANLVVNNTTPNQLTITVDIFPQPAWEVLKLHNGGGAATIATIVAVSECEPIPSTTTYGLGILALLLIGSTVWILRRKRAGAVA